jgi:hypothetical protein
MNNEAFQALVRDRSSIHERSSKEIAREAVEEEFKRKKRKRGGGGDSSSDEEENKKESRRPLEDASKDRHHHQQYAQSSKELSDAGEAAATKYRDRARERREGKILLNEKASDIVQANNNNKFDESNNNIHHVKGLDVALARKEKQVDRPRASTNNDAETSSPVLLTLVQDSGQAKRLLEQSSRSTFTSELGKDMFEFLQKQFMPTQRGVVKSSLHCSTSTAGVAIQRSRMNFSSSCNPHDKARAWETPLEITQAALGETDIWRESDRRLNHELIDRITSVLTPVVEDHNGPQQLQIPVISMASATTKNSLKTTSKDEAASDDDIFDETDSQELKEEASLQVSSSITKGSIFSGLDTTLTETFETNESKREQPGLMSSIARQQQQGEASGTAQKTKQGVSLSAYGGYYGEEMDVDFDGRFVEEDKDDDDDVNNKKKKKKKDWSDETTLAAKEYGGRSRRKGTK